MIKHYVLFHQIHKLFKKYGTPMQKHQKSTPKDRDFKQSPEIDTFGESHDSGERDEQLTPVQFKLPDFLRPFADSQNDSGEVVQKEESPNQTGIPDSTKEKFEKSSGLSFDDVKVNYDSDKPAQLNALAYTQGNQVHIGPGQERHLEHELGHVVQQKQGRVQPTASVGGMAVNDDAGLESEADSGVVQGKGIAVNGNSNEVVQGEWPAAIKREIGGDKSAHHIIPKELMKKFKNKLDKEGNPRGVNGKDWSDFKTLGFQFLQGNAAIGPSKYVNNPGSDWDPDTEKVDIEESDEGLTNVGLDSFDIEEYDIEKRVLSERSKELKDLHKIIKNYVDNKENPDDWKGFMKKLEFLKDAPVIKREDEWVKINENTNYRKREGIIVNNLGEGEESIFKKAEEIREYSSIEEAVKIEETYNKNGCQINIEINFPHILERHSFLWWAWETKGVNIFFPFNWSESTISDWCVEKARELVELNIDVLKKRADEEDSDSIIYDMVNVNDVFVCADISAVSNKNDTENPYVITAIFKTMCVTAKDGIQITENILEANKPEYVKEKEREEKERKTKEREEKKSRRKNSSKNEE
jgi:hypothetical protein